MVRDSNIWTIHLTVFLICLREALESTVFLASEIKTDPIGVVQGLVLGVVLLSLIVYAMEKLGKSLVNKIMFRYVSYALLIAAVYYLFRGITEILEQNFGLDIF
jgi:high-affinity Fe2+/Pb2+ permease